MPAIMIVITVLNNKYDISPFSIVARDNINYVETASYMEYLHA